MIKKALITGITGQDGSYLAEFLLNKNYEVHGMVRRASTFNRSRIEKYFDFNNYTKKNIKNRFYLHYGDLIDSSSISNILLKTKKYIISLKIYLMRTMRNIIILLIFIKLSEHPLIKGDILASYNISFA